MRTSPCPLLIQPIHEVLWTWFMAGRNHHEGLNRMEKTKKSERLQLLKMMWFLLLGIALAESVQIQQGRFKGPPVTVNLTLHDNEIVIQTLDVQYIFDISKSCFKLALRMKTSKEMEWQRTITSSECSEMGPLLQCSFSHNDLDPEKCFHAQLQFETVEDCGYDEIYVSEWSETIFMEDYRLVESCDVPTPTTFEVQDSGFFIILFSVISTLMIFVIVFVRCNMERIKNCIFPIIPDPKNSFHNLFDSHNGYFQEWVKTPIHDTHPEVECVMDVQNDEPVSTYVKETEVVMPLNQSVIKDQEDNVTPASASLKEEASNVCFGNMNFTMTESMYVML